MESCLGEPIVVKKWVMNGLPSDAFSRENGMIIKETSRWPLLIDPQSQANKWIKNHEADNKLVVSKQTDHDFVRNLENAVQFGFSFLIENASEEMDSILDPLLSKQFFKNQGVVSIKIGENILEFAKTFRLFITSKMRNPNYTPEISTKVTLVNFMITKEGLEDQLLEVAVTKEKPELEEQRTKLIIQDHENKKQLFDIEKQILDVLNKEGNILDDENALEILTKSKSVSNEIEEKQKAAMVFYSKVLPDAGNLNGKRHAHHNVCRRSVGGVNENGVCHDTAPKYLHFAVLFCGQRWLRNCFHRFLESEKLRVYMNERSRTPPERF